MTKKRKLWILIIAILVLSIIAVMLLFQLNKNTMRKYIVIQNEIFYEDKVYVKMAENLFAIALADQIGVTDLDQQVYAIEGQDMNEWICVRTDGVEGVYRDNSIPYLVVDRFNTNKMIIKEESISGGTQKTIVDREIIDVSLGYLVDENLVNMSEEPYSMIMALNLYSDDFKGLCITLYYLHDENDNCFIYNSNTEEVWKIGHELMQQLS